MNMEMNEPMKALQAKITKHPRVRKALRAALFNRYLSALDRAKIRQLVQLLDAEALDYLARAILDGDCDGEYSLDASTRTAQRLMVLAAAIRAAERADDDGHEDAPVWIKGSELMPGLIVERLCSGERFLTVLHEGRIKLVSRDSDDDTFVDVADDDCFQILDEDGTNNGRN